MLFRRWVLIVIVLVTSLASPSLGAAQATHEEQALVLARRAAHRFQAGDFGTAATLLREAIALHETAALHINLARTLNRLERWQEARDAYLRYLVLEADSESRLEVEEAIRELDERIASTEAPEPWAPPEVRSAEDMQGPEVVEASPALDEETALVAPNRNRAPWFVLGAGILVVTAGIPLSVLSGSAAERARSAPNQVAADDPAREARTFAITADVLYAVGGAAALSGLIWGLLTRGSDEGEVSLQVYPGGAAVRARF